MNPLTKTASNQTRGEDKQSGEIAKPLFVPAAVASETRPPRLAGKLKYQANDQDLHLRDIIQPGDERRVNSMTPLFGTPGFEPVWARTIRATREGQTHPESARGF